MKQKQFADIRRNERWMADLETAVNSLSEVCNWEGMFIHETQEETVAQAHGILTMYLNSAKEQHAKILKELE